SYDSPSITWHQWHHTAPMSSKIGLSSPRARASAASPQGCQCTGWWAADFKYAEGSVARRLAIAGNLHPRARTPPVHHAQLALRPPRDADLAPVLNQGVREPGPLVARHEGHQIALDLHGIPLLREAEQRRQALHVGVHHDALVLTERRAEHDVGGLAADSGELH